VDWWLIALAVGNGIGILANWVKARRLKDALVLAYASLGILQLEDILEGAEDE